MRHRVFLLVVVSVAMLTVTSTAGAWSFTQLSATPVSFNGEAATKYVFGLDTDGYTTNAMDVESNPAFYQQLGGWFGQTVTGSTKALVAIADGPEVDDDTRFIGLNTIDWMVAINSDTLLTSSLGTVKSSDFKYYVFRPVICNPFDLAYGGVFELIVPAGNTPVQVANFQWVPTSGPHSGALFETPIIVNTIPEPVSLALWIFGGLTYLRRQRA